MVPGSEDLGLQSELARVSSVARMAITSVPTSILSLTECWELLDGSPVGRLVTNVDGQSEIFPVNFAVQGRTILFRTAEGTKLVSAAINDRVLFEVDGYSALEGWSVIVKGLTRTLRTEEELAEAEQARLRPWTSAAKQHFVRIRPLNVTGRRFVFDPEPDVGPASR